MAKMGEITSGFDGKIEVLLIDGQVRLIMHNVSGVINLFQLNQEINRLVNGNGTIKE